MISQPNMIAGGLAVDDRGQVSFVNDFNFNDVKRFYQVSNHSKGFVRAWHAHKNETKYVYVANGAAIVGAVEIDNFENPNKNLKPHRFIISSKKPSILFIPKGYANGFMSLTDDTIIQFFSTSKLEDSLNDDYRFDARYWDIWQIEER